MKAPDDDSQEVCSLETWIADLFNEARATLHQRSAECEAYVRRSPMPSLLVAAGIGYVVSKLPLGAIAAALARLFFALLRPTAILFCAIKVYDWLIQKPRRAPSIPATPAVPSDPAPPF